MRDRIVAETRGNPLALLELPRGLTPAELAGGFGLPDALPLSGRIEESFLRRLEALPARHAAAAAGGGGRAGRRPGAAVARGRAARDRRRGGGAGGRGAGLLELGARVRFRHPLVRSAVYRAASPATGSRRTGRWPRRPIRRSIPTAAPGIAPQATAGPDEDVAAELERSAGRAQARGGLAAAAAFLERAAALTPDPARRARARAGRGAGQVQAGALDAALELLATARGRTARRAPARARRAAARSDRVRRASAAATRRRCCSRPPSGSSRSTRGWRARPTSRRSRGAVRRPPGRGGGVLEVAEAARAAPPPPQPPRAPICSSTAWRRCSPRATRPACRC